VQGQPALDQFHHPVVAGFFNALLHRAQRAGATTAWEIATNFPARPLRSGASRSLEAHVFFVIPSIISYDLIKTLFDAHVSLVYGAFEHHCRTDNFMR
jgi:hypothetical protein